MKTKSISLFYIATPTEIKPPAIKDLEIKDRFVKGVQQSVESEWKPKIIKVTYEEHNPDIDKQCRFFNGTCVKYYAIQNEDMFSGQPNTEMLKMYRKDILDQMLGYDVHLTNRVIRERKSTTEFKSVKAWDKFLKTLEETLFESAGYYFPDSEEFWKLDSQYGYDEAERISIENLQKIMKSKYGKRN